MTTRFRENYFVFGLYNGSDGDDFKCDFLEYLQNILDSNSFEAMSDHELFLQGGKRMLEEIITEMKTVHGAIREDSK